MRIFLLLLLCPPAAAAQTGNLAGRVVGDLGNPLSGANVIIEGTRLGAATDIGGNYFIVGAPVGQHVVSASFVGYAPRTDTAYVTTGYTSRLDFELGLESDACEVDSTYQEEDLSRLKEFWLPRAHLIAEAYGLAPLPHQPSGQREARLWLILPGWYNSPLVRLTWQNEEVTGELIVGEPFRDWDEEAPAGVKRRLENFRGNWAHRCNPIQRGDSAEACAVEFAMEPDWDSLARELAEAGLWTLPDESVLPRSPHGCIVVISNGGGYFAELFDGTSYRTYKYGSPYEESLWPEERQAALIYEHIRNVVRLIPPWR